MKLLLVSDTGMNVNKGGFQQTLFNIFSFLQPPDFLFITSVQANKIAPPSPPFTSRTITYNLRLIPVQQNRLGKYVNNLVNYFNFTFNYTFKRFRLIKTVIKKFNPDVIIVAPNGAEGVIIYHLLKDVFKNKKVFPYFMDDWLYQLKQNRFGKNIHALAEELLAANTAWLMISKNLADILAKRYAINPARVLEIHNPVNIKNIIQPTPVTSKKEFIIAYAGALWQMHFDAFAVIAEAIKILQTKRIVKLVVYTEKANWDWRKDELKMLSIEYGGHIPYSEIHQKLAEADCLLLNSSFLKEWQTHSKGSVQTKITDYLKAGRLIISCGPAYSANHYFLKKYNCGICIETDNVNDVANELNDVLDSIEDNQQYVLNGFEVLETEFSSKKVHQKLKDFLSVNRIATGYVS